MCAAGRAQRAPPRAARPALGRAGVAARPLARAAGGTRPHGRRRRADRRPVRRRDARRAARCTARAHGAVLARAAGGRRLRRDRRADDPPTGRGRRLPLAARSRGTGEVARAVAPLPRRGGSRLARHVARARRLRSPARRPGGRARARGVGRAVPAADGPRGTRGGADGDPPGLQALRRDARHGRERAVVGNRRRARGTATGSSPSSPPAPTRGAPWRRSRRPPTRRCCRRSRRGSHASSGTTAPTPKRWPSPHGRPASARNCLRRSSRTRVPSPRRARGKRRHWGRRSRRCPAPAARAGSMRRSPDSRATSPASPWRSPRPRYASRRSPTSWSPRTASSPTSA